MTENEIGEMLRRMVVADVTVAGLLNFLKSKGLEEEGKKYVENFIKSVSQDDWREIISKAKGSLEDK